MSELASPLPGYVAKVHVAVGDQVKVGDPIVALQSMKMEIAVPAEFDGAVQEILVNEGDELDTGTLIARFI